MTKMADENKSHLFFLIILVSISIVSSLIDPKCGQLPNNECELKSYYCNVNTNMKKIDNSKCYIYMCDRIDANFEFSQTEVEQISNCSLYYEEVYEARKDFYFRLSKPSILDGSFDLFNSDLFLTTLFVSSENQFTDLYERTSNLNRVTFRYIKGFDVGNFKQRHTPTRMDFYYSNFDFYLNRSLIRSCEDIEQLDKFPRYIFDTLCIYGEIFGFPSVNDVRFYNCEYKTPICPLIILKLKTNILRFIGIQNTYYKSNYPRFLPFPKSFLNLSYYLYKPDELDLINMQNIELNSKILNRFIFNKIYMLRLFGDIVSIEPGLFKTFKNLIWIQIDILSTRKLMHRGIDWMLDLNSEIQVDLTDNNITFLNASTINHCVEIDIYQAYEQGVITSRYFNSYDTFPDEDFCLYLKFPFEQLISMIFFSAAINPDDCSCTYLWISNYNRIVDKLCNRIKDSLNPYNKFGEKIESKINKCNFKQR